MIEIEKTISEWAKNTFSGSSCGYEATIAELPSAPPFLFTGSTGSGFCVTIKPVATFLLSTSAFSSPATAAEPLLGFWIPESGTQGSQCTRREGDEEILTFAVDWFKVTRTDAATGEETPLANEDALSENLSALFAEFLRDDILLPALEKHLDDNGIAHEPFTIDMVGGIDPWDEKNWAFLFLPAEPIVSSESFDQPDWSTSRVLGITGDGRAALFGYSRHAVEPRGYVDHIHLKSQASDTDSPAAIQSWLEETIVTMSSLSQA